LVSVHIDFHALQAKIDNWRGYVYDKVIRDFNNFNLLHAVDQGRGISCTCFDLYVYPSIN